MWKTSSDREFLFERRGPYLDVVTASNWLEDEICNQLISDFTPMPQNWRTNAESWWPDFTKYPRVQESLAEIGDIIESITSLAVNMINPHIIHWKPNAKMGIHTDIGGVQSYPERRWSSIIYLNSPPEGGKTLIPDRGLKIIPTCGNLLVWPGSMVRHRVEEVPTSRYVLTCWWGNRTSGTLSPTEEAIHQEKTKLLQRRWFELVEATR